MTWIAQQQLVEIARAASAPKVHHGRTRAACRVPGGDPFAGRASRSAE
jgi:hypothetical protein